MYCKKTTIILFYLSKIIVELIRLLSEGFLLNLNIELVFGTLTSPILLHDQIDEFFNCNDFLVCLIVVELASFPYEHLVLSLYGIIIVYWSLAKHEQSILLEIIKVKDRHRFVPIREFIKFWLCFLFLFHYVFVVLHLSHDWSFFDKIDCLKL